MKQHRGKGQCRSGRAQTGGQPSSEATQAAQASKDLFERLVEKREALLSSGDLLVQDNRIYHGVSFSIFRSSKYICLNYICYYALFPIIKLYDLFMHQVIFPIIKLYVSHVYIRI